MLTKFLVTVTVFFRMVVTMPFIVAVAVLLYFLISLEHCDDMRHGGMAECGEIEMHDHKGAEEDPESYVDKDHNLYPADKIHCRSEKMRVPEEKAGYELDGNQKKHDRKV